MSAFIRSFNDVEKKFIPVEAFRRSVARLRIVSNFGDSGEIHARARTKMGSREETRHEEGAHFRVRACISPESPKLEILAVYSMAEKVKKFVAVAVFDIVQRDLV